MLWRPSPLVRGCGYKIFLLCAFVRALPLLPGRLQCVLTRDVQRLRRSWQMFNLRQLRAFTAKATLPNCRASPQTPERTVRFPAPGRDETSEGGVFPHSRRGVFQGLFLLPYGKLLYLTDHLAVDRATAWRSDRTQTTIPCPANCQCPGMPRISPQRLTKRLDRKSAN